MTEDARGGENKEKPKKDLGKIVEEKYPFLLSYAKKNVVADQNGIYEAGDIVSSAVEKVIRYVEQNPKVKEGGNFLGLLLIAIRHKGIDSLRSEGRKREKTFLGMNFDKYSDEMKAELSGETYYNQEDLLDARNIRENMFGSDGAVFSRSRNAERDREIVNLLLDGHLEREVAEEILKKFSPEKERTEENLEKARELVGRAYRRAMERAREELLLVEKDESKKEGR